MEDESQNTPAPDTAQVRFGKNIHINTKARLPRFDNGSSLAYQAYNTDDRTKSFIALVADVTHLPRWSSIANYNALADTSFMRLVGSGAVHWPLEGKQKYIFMYAAEDIGECLVKESSFADISWRHPDIIEIFYPAHGPHAQGDAGQKFCPRIDPPVQYLLRSR